MAEAETFDDRLVEFMNHFSRRIEAGINRSHEVCHEAGDALANSDPLLEATHGGTAYRLWMDASDIYDAPRHDVSEAAARRKLDEHTRALAGDWMSIDMSSSDAVSDYFSRWVG